MAVYNLSESPVDGIINSQSSVSSASLPPYHQAPVINILSSNQTPVTQSYISMMCIRHRYNYLGCRHHVSIYLLHTPKFKTQFFNQEKAEARFSSCDKVEKSAGTENLSASQSASQPAISKSASQPANVPHDFGGLLMDALNGPPPHHTP